MCPPVPVLTEFTAWQLSLLGASSGACVHHLFNRYLWRAQERIWRYPRTWRWSYHEDPTDFDQILSQVSCRLAVRRTRAVKFIHRDPSAEGRLAACKAGAEA